MRILRVLRIRLAPILRLIQQPRILLQVLTRQLQVRILRVDVLEMGRLLILPMQAIQKSVSE